MTATTDKGGKWTYSGNPGFSAKDQVRFLIGDTDPDDPQLYDGEIEWTLSQYNNAPLNAAVRAVESVMTKYSRQVDENVGQVKIFFSQRLKAYQQTQNILLQRLAREDAIPYAGGIYVSDKQTQDMNTNRVRPDFTKHMMENYDIAPWVTSNGYDLWLEYQG